MTDQQDVWTGLPIGKPRGPKAWRDDLVLKIVGASLDRFRNGRVRLRLPSGRTGIFGDGATTAQLHARRFSAILRSARRGALGFAESYMDGHIDTPDLLEVFRVYHDNYGVLSSSARGFLRPRLADKFAHRQRRNSRAGSRRNIAAHYDLGNDFYRLWLDDGMTYSSGIYRDPAWSLDQAQADKYRTILRSLDLVRGHSVLEIGCGWGGMAECAAAAGGRVTAITISSEQLAWATARLASAPPSSSAEVRFEDYRDVSGSFDRIVSVEMIEAVGEENWATYFRTLSERLAPGGRGVIQAITIDEQHFDEYRRRPDFIQRYIFPGGMLPTITAMRASAAAAGLRFEVIERFGASYARTLSDWRDRFRAAWPEIAKLGFDERFRRMWEFYLAYCEVGFERGCIDVGLYKVTKPELTASA